METDDGTRQLPVFRQQNATNKAQASKWESIDMAMLSKAQILKE
jgi:hypothetical protein